MLLGVHGFTGEGGQELGQQGTDSFSPKQTRKAGVFVVFVLGIGAGSAQQT